MEQLLLENNELINKIKKEYDKILKENKSLKENKFNKGKVKFRRHKLV